MKSIYLSTMLVVGVVAVSCEKTKEAIAETKTEVATAGDVGFAKSTFESLARGDSSVAGKIDWPVFVATGVNHGAAYVALNTPADKDKFVAQFITQFSSAFRESGGSVDNFTNWRVVAHDSQRTEVAADSAASGKTMTIIVSVRDGVERVSSINSN